MKPKRASLWLAIALLLVLSALPNQAAVVMSPYLQAVTANSIYVLVECDSTDAVKVEYGPTETYGAVATTESTAATEGSVPQTYVHNIKLAGLQPDTVYHYRVSQGGEPTADQTFTTAALPGASFRFAIMGDCRTGVKPHAAIAARIAAADPRFSVYLGDLCVNKAYDKFKNEFFLPEELALIAKVPFMNAVGNHENWSPNTQAFTEGISDLSGTQDYYSFDYGDIHFVCINNQVPYTVDSPQYAFVAKDLAATKQPWKIVYFHKPAYGSGGHGEDTGMKAMTAALFEPNKVDLVLAGHSHFYQHNRVNGIPHLVIGGGGAPLVQPVDALYTVKSAKLYNYAIVDFTPASLHLVVHDDAGNVIDTIDLAKPAMVKQ